MALTKGGLGWSRLSAESASALPFLWVQGGSRFLHMRTTDASGKIAI